MMTMFFFLGGGVNYPFKLTLVFVNFLVVYVFNYVFACLESALTCALVSNPE